MDEKTKELIAVGASVGAHCQPCLEYHVNKARAVGLTDDEIREAIAVGQMVEKGAMAAMRDFAGSILGASEQAASSCCGSNASKSGKKCCG